MDRRVLLKGLFGVAGAGALAVVLPPQAEVLAGIPSANPPRGSVLPDFEELTGSTEESDELETLEEGIEPASHRYWRRRRRRRRRRRWRRYCRRYWWHGYWRRRCRRRGFWITIWI